MNEIRTTISGLSRVMHCGLSAVAPQASQAYPDEWRRLGDVCHAFLARVPEVGVATALGEVPEDLQPFVSCIDVGRTPACRPDAYAREVAFEWDWNAGTAREIGRKIERRYPRLPGMLYGSTDIVGLREDRLIVYDYKFGFADLASPAENWQMLGYAIAGTLAYGKTKATVGLIRFRDGEPRYAQADLDEMDLAGRAWEVGSRLGELQVADPATLRPCEGEWCERCPAFFACPAKQTLARAMGGAREDLMALFSGGAITTDNAAKVLNLVQTAREVLDFIHARVDEFAKTTPFELPDGKVYGAYSKKLRDDIDKPKAREVILTRYGEQGQAVWEASLKTPEPSFVKDRFKEAVRAIAAARGTGITAEVEAAFEELRKAGAATPVNTTIVGAHKAKKGAK